MAIQVTITEFNDTKTVNFVNVQEFDDYYKLIINTNDRWLKFVNSIGVVKIENEDDENIAATVEYKTDERCIAYSKQEKDQIYIILIKSKLERANTSFVVR